MARSRRCRRWSRGCDARSAARRCGWSAARPATGCASSRTSSTSAGSSGGARRGGARGGPGAMSAGGGGCAGRWRSGAGRRWPTWRSSRSRRPRSRAWRTCARPRSRIASRPISRWAAVPSSWPSSKGSSRRSRCASACAGSSCSRCIGPGVKARRWMPTATWSGRLTASSACVPDRSSSACSRRSSPTIPRCSRARHARRRQRQSVAARPPRSWAPSPRAVRVGVAAGDVTWAGEDYSGTPVIEAQRLCAAASTGSILVADAVRLLAGSGTEAELEDAGELELGDLVRPVRAWSVGWTARRAVTVPFPASLVFEGGTAFAGREEELAGLRAAWADAVSGRRRGVLVSGEPGIGKTRLAAETAAHARAREGVVLYGRCDDGLSAPAQPFAQALGAYIAACPVDELRVELGARASDLVQLLPELAARLPGCVAEPAPAEPEIQQLRTLEAAAALLEAAGATVPVLVVLDDLHWADDLSLLLLRHLLRLDASVRLLVVATYRDTEPSRSALLGEVVTGLARRPDVARLELGPLSERDVAAILAHSGRQASLAGRVRRATAGNPFFVDEMVRALDHSQDPGAALTPRVRDVVRWRLA